MYITRRVFMLLCTVGMILLVGLTMLSYSQNKELLITETTTRAKDVAVTFSKLLDGDEVREGIESHSKTENYDEWKKKADDTLKECGLLYFYIMNANYSGSSVAYYISAEDDEAPIYFLDQDDVKNFEEAMFLMIDTREPATSKKIYATEDYAAIISGYAPLFDSNGDVVALIGADVSAKEILSSLQAYFWRILLAGVIGIVAVGIFIMFAIQKMFVIPIIKLSESIGSFNAGGVRGEKIKAHNRNEITALTENVKCIEEKITLVTKQAQTDSLTKMNNRERFSSDVKEALGRILSEENIENQNKLSAFFIIDLDYFKQINDGYGHQAGDTVLKCVGVVLKEIFSGEKMFSARIGGDEFTVFCYDLASKSEIEHLANEIKEKFSAITYAMDQPALTASVGVSVVDLGSEKTREIIGDHSKAYSTLFNIADQSLYKVKARGRNGSEILSVFTE